MDHYLVVAAGVGLLDGVFAVQARLPVCAELEALQHLAVGQQDRNMPLAGERVVAVAAPDQHAAAGLPRPLLRRGEVEGDVHTAKETWPQTAKGRGVEVGCYAAVVEGVAPRRNALPRGTPDEVGDPGAEYPLALQLLRGRQRLVARVSALAFRHVRAGPGPVLHAVVQLHEVLVARGELRSVYHPVGQYLLAASGSPVSHHFLPFVCCNGRPLQPGKREELTAGAPVGVHVDVHSSHTARRGELPEPRLYIAPRLAPAPGELRVPEIPVAVSIELPRLYRVHVKVVGIPGHIRAVPVELARRVAAVPETPGRVDDQRVVPDPSLDLGYETLELVVAGC